MRLFPPSGKYPIIATIDNNNYVLDNATKTAEIEIEKVNLTIVAKGDLIKTYGMKDPTLETEYVDSWAYSEDKALAENLILIRETGEDVGEFLIESCTLESDNYNVVYENENEAKLTIAAKSLMDEDITITIAKDADVYQSQAKNFVLDTKDITVTYGNRQIDKNKNLLVDTNYTFTINEVKKAGETIEVIVKAVTDGNYIVGEEG